MILIDPVYRWRLASGFKLATGTTGTVLGPFLSVSHPSENLSDTVPRLPLGPT